MNDLQRSFSLLQWQPLPAAITDSLGSILYRNVRFEQTFKALPFSNQIQHYVRDNDSRTGAPLHLRLLQDAVEATTIEQRYILQQELCWFNVHVSRDDQGKTYLYLFEEVTDIKLTQEALRLADHRWRIFAGNELNLFLQTTIEGLISDASPSLLNLLGYPLDAIVNTNIRTLIHPEDLNQFDLSFRFWGSSDGFRSRNFRIECRFKKRSLYVLYDDWVYLNIQAQPLPETNNQITLLLYAVDISERKQLELELRKGEEQFRTLVQNLPGAVYRCDVRYIFSFLSQEIETITGYKAETFLNRKYAYVRLILHEDVSRIEESLNQAIQDDSFYNVEYRIQNAAGEIRWVQDRGRACFDRSGRLLWLDGVLFDITDSKAAELCLQQSEERFRAIFEQSVFGINLMDLNQQFIRVNQRQCEMLGYSPDEFLSLSHQALTLPNEADIEERKLQELLQDEIDSFNLEKIDIKRDGSRMWVSLTCSLIQDQEGNPNYFVTIIEDISQRKRAEQAAQRLLKLLRTSLELSEDGILILDHQWQLLVYNQQFVNLWQIPAALLQQPDDWQLVNDLKQNVVNAEEFVSQIQREYNSPEVEDVRQIELRNGKLLLRVSQPQLIDDEVIGRIISYRVLRH